MGKKHRHNGYNHEKKFSQQNHGGNQYQYSFDNSGKVERYNIGTQESSTGEKQPRLVSLDSGVVIALSKIDALIKKGIPLTNIRAAMNYNNNNITNKEFNALVSLLLDNKEGNVKFCVVPTVFKETWMDKKVPDMTTRQFLHDNCSLLWPQDEIAFAKNVAILSERYKKVVTLGFEKNRYTGADDNFEDRVILAETTLFAREGHAQYDMVSLSSQKVTATHDRTPMTNDVRDNYRLEWQMVDTQRPNNDPRYTFGGNFGTHDEGLCLLQINSADYGRRQDDPDDPHRRVSQETKSLAAEQINQINNDFFSREVCFTPSEFYELDGGQQEQ